MKKKTSLLLAAFALLLTAAHGQNADKFKLVPEEWGLTTPKAAASSSVENEIVKRAAEAVLFVTQSSFQIKDPTTDKRYGLNGNKEFGTHINIGVKVKGGVIIADETIHPWNYNDKYQTYQQQYSPILSETTYSLAQETLTELAFDTLRIDCDSLVALTETVAYALPTDLFKGEGLEVSEEATQEKGWMVWVAVVYNGQQEVRLNYVISEQSLPFSEEQRCLSVEKPNESEAFFLGAIFLTADYGTPGQVAFRLAAVVTENSEGWRASLPTPHRIHSELTPIL